MSLDFKATLDDSSFQKGIDNMAKSATAKSGEISKAFSGAASAVSGLAGAFGVSLGVGGIIAGGKAILDFAGNIQDMSDATGLSVQAFQELSGAFAQSGVDSEKFGKAIGTLTTKMEEARGGNEDAIKAFEKLGISWQQIETASPEEMINLLADGLKNSKNETESFAAATELLGKGQLKLIGSMKQGSEALNEQRKAISTLAADEVKALDDAGDAITRFFTKAKVTGAQALLVLRDVASTIHDYAELGGDLLYGNKITPDAAPSEARKGGADSSPSRATMFSKGKVVHQDPRDAKAEKEMWAEYYRMEEEANQKRQTMLRQLAGIEEDRKDAQRAFYEDGLTGDAKLKALEEDRAELQMRIMNADDTELANLQKKLGLKELELQKEEKLQKLKGKNELLNTLQGALSKAAANGQSIEQAAIGFGLLSNDERRGIVRQEHRNTLEKNRHDRLQARKDAGEKGRIDARFGANGKNRSLGEVTLAKETVQALSAEIDKLIAR